MSETKTAKKLVKIYIKKDLCKGCTFCIDFCPPKVLEISIEFNKKGYHHPVVKFQEKCSGCNLCTMLCPDFAIWTSKRG